MIITTTITDNDLSEAVAVAEHKLALILEREGDADGARREPWYFDMLVDEELRTMKHKEKINAPTAL